MSGTKRTVFMPVEIFVCYAHKDKYLLNQLYKHIILLRNEGYITLWHDGDISPGTEWEHEIERHMDLAQVILLLISPDFMASNYCYHKEMKRAMKRHELGEARVIPIILRSVHWTDAPFGKLQALPTNEKPITAACWRSQDEAFCNVSEGIRKVIKELNSMPDKKMLRKKVLLYQNALAEIFRTGFDFCPECGSTEIIEDTHIDHSHDEMYTFKRCEKCDHTWE